MKKLGATFRRFEWYHDILCLLELWRPCFYFESPAMVRGTTEKNARADEILWNQQQCTFFLSDTTICNNLQFFSSKNYLFYRYKFILFENCASNLIYVLNLLFFWQNFDRYLSFHLISDNLASPIFFLLTNSPLSKLSNFKLLLNTDG